MGDLTAAENPSLGTEVPCGHFGLEIPKDLEFLRTVSRLHAQSFQTLGAGGPRPSAYGGPCARLGFASRVSLGAKFASCLDSGGVDGKSTWIMKSLQEGKGRRGEHHHAEDMFAVLKLLARTLPSATHFYMNFLVLKWFHASDDSLL